MLPYAAGSPRRQTLACIFVRELRVDSTSPPSAIRRLGQNFLVDPNIVRKIVALAELSPADTVLEIGPGRGILTEALCRAAGHVTAIEVDPRLHRFLSERNAHVGNVTLLLGDALTCSIEQLPIGTIVVANLPYYISTPLLFRLLAQGNRFARMVLMLQNEVADRLIAKPGSSDYGVLSVMAQYSAKISKAFKVSPQCFRPRPDVDSAVVLLRALEPRVRRPEEERRFTTFVRAAFAHRRKTLVNSLKNEGYDSRLVETALTRLHLSPSLRAETLTLEQFLELAHCMEDLR